MNNISKTKTDEDALLRVTTEFEDAHLEGASAKAIVEHFGTIGDPISEPTFRKYVQLGLLSRSTRVGQVSGRGSHGLYPKGTATRVLWIRRWMAEGYTIDEIQHGFLLVREDLDSLDLLARKAIATLESHSGFSRLDAVLSHSLAEAKRLHGLLIQQLNTLEQQLSLRARMARAVL